MSKAKEEIIIIDGAKVCSRNFSGEKTQYNKNGARKFTVFLDQEVAESLIDQGWNVRVRPPREEGDPNRYYLDVSVGFEFNPPVVKLVGPKGAVVLGEDSIDILDKTIFKHVKIAIRARHWEVNGKTGIKAYLKTGYFYAEADEFEEDLDEDMHNIYGV